MTEERSEEARGASGKRFLLPGLALGLVVAVVSCSSQPDPWKDVAGSPRIVVTTAPLYSFTRAVAGKRAAIQCLCTTTGPHHYETDHRDAVLLQSANLFLAVGLQLDDRFSDAMMRMSHRDRPPDRLPYVKLGEHLPKGLVHKARAWTQAHRHGDLDPHVWLGTEQVVAMVGLIRDELIKIDEAHADEYRKNAAAYVEKVRKLGTDGKKMFADKKTRQIISFHDALSYFADSFGLEIADVIETGPGDNPTQRHLAHLVELCRARPIGAITVEPQYPESSSADKLMRELKGKGITVRLVEVDPLETADPDELQQEGGGWYERRMRSNLKALAGVLK
jgi:ABC-type Zn uptake system ZnuABC Zn-binding protein ZnuA